MGNAQPGNQDNNSLFIHKTEDDDLCVQSGRERRLGPVCYSTDYLKGLPNRCRTVDMGGGDRLNICYEYNEPIGSTPVIGGLQSSDVPRSTPVRTPVERTVERPVGGPQIGNTGISIILHMNQDDTPVNIRSNIPMNQVPVGQVPVDPNGGPQIGIPSDEQGQTVQSNNGLLPPPTINNLNWTEPRHLEYTDELMNGMGSSGVTPGGMELNRLYR